VLCVDVVMEQGGPNTEETTKVGDEREKFGALEERQAPSVEVVRQCAEWFGPQGDAA